jgi:hypothetical protein
LVKGESLFKLFYYFIPELTFLSEDFCYLITRISPLILSRLAYFSKQQVLNFFRVEVYSGLIQSSFIVSSSIWILLEYIRFLGIISTAFLWTKLYTFSISGISKTFKLSILPTITANSLSFVIFNIFF